MLRGLCYTLKLHLFMSALRLSALLQRLTAILTILPDGIRHGFLSETNYQLVIRLISHVAVMHRLQPNEIYSRS